MVHKFELYSSLASNNYNIKFSGFFLLIYKTSVLCFIIPIHDIYLSSDHGYLLYFGPHWGHAIPHTGSSVAIESLSLNHAV